MNFASGSSTSSYAAQPNRREAAGFAVLMMPVSSTHRMRVGR